MDAKNDNVAYGMLEMSAKKMLLIWINVFWNLIVYYDPRPESLSSWNLYHIQQGIQHSGRGSYTGFSWSPVESTLKTEAKPRFLLVGAGIRNKFKIKCNHTITAKSKLKIKKNFKLINTRKNVFLDNNINIDQL